MKNNYLAGVLFVLAGVLLLVWTINGKVSFFQWPTGERELLESREFDGAFQELNIQTNSTDVIVQRSDDDALRVEVYGYRSQQKHYRLEMEDTGESLQVLYRQNNRESWFGFKRGHRLVIALPDRAFRDIAVLSSSGDVSVETALEADRVKLETSSGDLRIGHVRADMFTVTTSSGDVSADATIDAAQADWHTSSGDIFVRSIQTGAFTVRTSSGELEAGTITGDSVSITGYSGDVEARNCECGLLQIELTSGDVDIDAMSGMANVEVSSGSVELNNWDLTGDSSIRASSGDVDISLLNGEQAMEIDLRAGSGSMQVALPGFETVEKTNNRLTGRIGNGGPKLTVQTSSGDISVE
ncbi:hypothetical protein DUZ99_03050 [Xylanibacillus composti]|uniref:DUF4097 domain-containing protein n=1 Tax=Xylanibacillus composti TaxID=1572762 RepID=A0A8J4H1T4_9BACL|nr:DUF4097 family beta strand repeat-containing protein [Xylanibacillus composti]MDT9723976.1 hypothetical protein [Xylanibacillus composti]GIQ67857.1 hypothetical protein XYCOK13_06810 [Xylanibacillus composti]